MHEVEAHFRPEFLNRIDESVVFHALNKGHISHIAMLQLTALMTRLKERSLGLVVSDEVRTYLAEQGFDPVYGARPLKRAIQRLIENPLAQALLTDQFAPGDVIEASMPGQQIVFAKAGEISRAA